MKINFLFVATLFAVIGVLFQPGAMAQTTIVANGKSTFSIIIPAHAPTSVKDAAQELQKCIEFATGAALPLKEDNAEVKAPVISLGNTVQARAVGISSAKMNDDSYRIVTNNGNLYILGVDTPNDGWTEYNGKSNGTANGVYTFLEDYLDVRWLMPGDMGRDVPAKSTFIVDDINRTETPLFNFRQVRYLEFYQESWDQLSAVQAWMAHMRVGENAAPVNFNPTHKWLKTINNSGGGGFTPNTNTPQMKNFYEEHQAWFAMDATGKRPYPNRAGKLETTNPEVVKWYAEQAIKNIKADPRHAPYSLSPSDGRGFSRSPANKALYDGYKLVKGKNVPIVSSLIMKWYHDVAQIVAGEYPQGKLCGFIYADYLTPPTKVDMELPENFIPMLAPGSTAGYNLYRPGAKEQFKDLISKWAGVTPDNWYYYGLPCLLIRQSRSQIGREGNFPGPTGNIVSPSPEILDFLFPTLLENHIKGTTLYGTSAWSSSALFNYTLAKMEWNPKFKASDIQREWLRRAYGPAAGKLMGNFYDELDGWFRNYFRKHEDARTYDLTTEMFGNLYGAHYPEMEKLFLQAKQQEMTKAQRQRLRLIENNLIVLQWRLRNMGALSTSFQSPLQRNGAQISDLIAEYNPAFSNFPAAAISNNDYYPYKLRSLPWKVQLSESTFDATKAVLPKWKNDQFLLYAARDGDIRITTQAVTHGAYFAAYEIRNEKGARVLSGIFNTEKPIVFPARKGHSYTLNIPLRQTVSFQLQVENAAMATGKLHDKTLLLSATAAPIYVFYQPGKAAMGAFEFDGGVSIRKPYSASLVKSFVKNKYVEGQVRVNPLDTGWLFSPDPKDDGLKRGVTQIDFDDNSWTPISPLNWWQAQSLGFDDYHGPAWYRFTFKGQSRKDGESVHLYFGAIDGNAAVYLNGTKIREHNMGPPPNYDGWNKAFAANITRYFKPDEENILAVKVTSKSAATASGIFRGVVLIMGRRK